MTRFDPDNADALCYGCHQFFTSNPDEHFAWQVERKGQRKVDEIILKSNKYKKRDDRAEVIKWKHALIDLTEQRRNAMM